LRSCCCRRRIDRADVAGIETALALLNHFNGLGADLEPGPGSNHPPAPRNASDNSLAVGPDHVFQIVNSQLAIFTKTGRIVYGPTSTNTIFAGMGGVCEARPNGDAVVRYDQLAKRWLVVMPIFRRTVFDADRSKPVSRRSPAMRRAPALAVPVRRRRFRRHNAVNNHRSRKMDLRDLLRRERRPIRSAHTTATSSSGRSFPTTRAPRSGPTATTCRPAPATK
jgi:hypothetical protein